MPTKWVLTQTLQSKCNCIRVWPCVFPAFLHFLEFPSLSFFFSSFLSFLLTETFGLREVK